MALPKTIESYLMNTIFGNRQPAYLQVGTNGLIIDGGGPLAKYGIRDLKKGKPVEEIADFLVGLVSPECGPELLPCVQTDTMPAADVHVIPDNEGHWVLLLDASEEAEEQRLLHQKGNELRLLRQNLDKSWRKNFGKKIDEYPPANEFNAFCVQSILNCMLDILVMERNPDGSFQILGDIPDWFAAICPDAGKQKNEFGPAEYFPFLELFLTDAEEFWSSKTNGQIRSGLWIETGIDSREYPLEAAAGIFQDKKIMLVERGRCSCEDNQVLLQKGRELHLAYRKLDQLQKELKIMSETDSLTGLHNRLKFNAVIKEEIARFSRYGNDLSLILFDIDHFKQVNDTYGHDIGDQVLREMSQIGKANLRETDHIFRWGGEEFLMLLPETGLSGAAEAAEKLRDAVQTHRFPTKHRVTISLGVSQLRTGDSGDAAIKKADEALYRAKENGRNRVEKESR